MKFISFNVNGYRAIYKKQVFNTKYFAEYLKDNDYDIIALQEVKAAINQVDLTDLLTRYNYVYWNSSKNKLGYSGVALLCKVKPLNVYYGIDYPELDIEGRVLTVEFDEFYFVVTYVPNAQEELKRIDFRLEYEVAFRKYVSSLDTLKPVIICGDLNVAHNDIDLKNPASNHFNPGFSDQERQAFSQLLSAGFVDVFRYLYPQKIQYTWWSYRSFARRENIGWRIDYFLVSRRFVSQVIDCNILDNVQGSDHCPIELIVK